MGVSSTLLASGGIRARWSANGTDAYAEVNSDERISKGIKFPTDGSLVDIVGENDDEVLCSFTVHKGSKCRRKRKVDNYNHGNNLIGTGVGTSGNGDSCDLFNCCMLGLTIMM